MGREKSGCLYGMDFENLVAQSEHLALVDLQLYPDQLWG